MHVHDCIHIYTITTLQYICSCSYKRDNINRDMCRTQNPMYVFALGLMRFFGRGLLASCSSSCWRSCSAFCLRRSCSASLRPNLPDTTSRHADVTTTCNILRIINGSHRIFIECSGKLGTHT